MVWLSVGQYTNMHTLNEGNHVVMRAEAQEQGLRMAMGMCRCLIQTRSQQ